MSMKRQATTDINQENWDQDDPADHEEMGMFKTAPAEDLQKRVIRTAKRRNQPGGDEAKKSVFSGFGGFNKTQPSSFDFLANLTNGNKTAQTAITTSTTTATTESSLFNSKPLTFQSSIVSSSTTLTNNTFGINSQPATLFGGSNTSTAQPSTLFTSSKPVTMVKDSPFNISGSSSSDPPFGIKTTPATTVSPTSSSVFGTASVSSSKSLFNNSSSTSAFKMQPVASKAPENNLFNMGSNTAMKDMEQNKEQNKKEETSFENKRKDEDEIIKNENRKKMKYYANIKALNESVLAWIKQNVEESPLCILTPIFKDYEKYLSDIQEQFHKKDVISTEPSKTVMQETFKSVASPVTKEISKPVCSTPFTSEKETLKFNEKKSPSLLSSNLTVNASSPSFSFGIKNSTTTSEKEAPIFNEKKSLSLLSSAPKADASSPNLSFGIKNNTTTSCFKPNTGTSTITSPFSNATTTSPSAPFSFGIGKPFSFSPNIQKPADTDNEKKENEEETDEPPKVEFTPVVEENSVYDKRCKIFVKKDDTFVDKGVGTLYIKKLESGKHQLLARANTNLGTVLLNLILASGVPTQRMGKNNVMLVCMPTPEAKPPPVPILIRVKTSEEADELLETLNKHKT